MEARDVSEDEAGGEDADPDASPEESMSTKTDPTESSIDNTGTWREAADNEWIRTDGPFGLVRIRAELPIEDAAKFNRAERTNTSRERVVLVHDDPIPSDPDEIWRGADEEAAREAALEYMEEL